MLDLYKTIENGCLFNAYMIVSGDMETCFEAADRICRILDVSLENRFLLENGKIESARELINSVSIKPFLNQKKIAVINGDNLSLNAANCILKTLEDPPDFVHFIVCYTNESNALDTIKSRCVKYYLDTFCYDDILNELRKRKVIKAEIFAAYANGNLNLALKLFNDKKFLQTRSSTVEFFSSYINGEIDDVLQEVKGETEKFFSQMLIFLDDCCNIYYGTDKRLRFGDFRSALDKFVRSFTIKQIVSIINSTTELIKLTKQNINDNLIFDNLKMGLLEVYYADSNRS